jgi:galactokinase
MSQIANVPFDQAIPIMSSSHERATSDSFVASPFSLSSATGTSPDAPSLAGQNKRLARVVRGFQAAFPTAKADALRVAVAPGRVNLIGEHIDYEGYSVLPMAIAQSMAVAVSTASPPSTPGGITMRIANTDPAYPTLFISLASQGDATGDALFQSLTAALDASTAWARYVLCGYMAAIEWSPALARQSFTADVLVDGTIPPACGLSSSSALVVASALALASALSAVGDLPTRTQLADKCRYAEQYVGTAGGGMDQAVSCLAAKNAALFVNFEPALQVEPVAFPHAFQRGEVVFLVVNSGVQAHKAEDAAERFNKRVVECALAAKLLGKRLNIAGWEKVWCFALVVHLKGGALSGCMGIP